jgi:hypothetical protein
MSRTKKQTIAPLFVAIGHTFIIPRRETGGASAPKQFVLCFSHAAAAVIAARSARF